VASSLTRKGWCSGQKPRAGRSVSGESDRASNREALRVIGEGDCDASTDKIESDANGDPVRRVRGETPGGGEAQEGIGSGRRLNPVDREDGFSRGTRP
jgi:hypothetical protein